MRFLPIIIILLLFSWGCPLAQNAPVLQWQKNYGGSMGDYPADFKVLPDGSIIMACSSLSVDGDISGRNGVWDFPDISVLKMGPTGNVLWSKHYGSDLADFARSIIPTKDGGFLVVGQAGGLGSDVTNYHGGFYDVWVLKLDASGKILWQKCFGGSEIDVGTNCVEASDGYIISADTESRNGDIHNHHGTDPRDEDIWIFKLDFNGNLVWERCFGGSLQDAFANISPSGDGNFLVYSLTDSYDGDVTGHDPAKLQQAWVFKISSAGTILWEKCVGTSAGGLVGKHILLNSDGTFFVAGQYFNSDLPGAGDGLNGIALQLDASGNIMWVKAYGGNGDEYFTDAINTPDGGYLLTGYTNSKDGMVCQKHPQLETWLVKIDASGNLQWSRTYGGSKNDMGTKLAFNPAGELLLLSSSNSTDGDILANKGDNDCWLKRFTLNGPLLYPSVSIRSETDSIVCSGKKVFFVATPVDGGPAPSYQWKLNGNNVGTNSDVLHISGLLATDVISCVLTSNSPCVDIKTAISNNLSVKVGPLKPPSNFLPKDTSLCNYERMEIIPNDQHYIDYLWSNNANTQTISIKGPGTYWLEVTDRFQCVGRDTITIFPKNCIEGVFVPNAFTPNKDGKNDRFIPLMLADVIQFRFIVYDRWGRAVFETSAIKNGWDGTYKGQPAEQGVYVWQCSYQLSGEQPVFKNGTVLLMR